MNAAGVSANPLLEDALTALPEIAQRLTVQPAVTPYPDWREWPAYDACVPVTAQACSALVAEWVSQAAARMAVRLPWRLPGVAVPVAEVAPGLSLGEQPHDPAGCDRGGGPHLGPCAVPPEPGEVADRIGAAMAEYAAEVGAEPVTDGPGIRDEFDDLEAAPATPDDTDAEFQAAMDAEFNAGDSHALDLGPVQAAAMDRFNEAHDAEAGPDGTTVMPAVEAHTEAIPAVTDSTEGA